MANSKRKCAQCGERKPAVEMFIRGAQAFCNSESYISYATKKSLALVKKGEKMRDKQNASELKELNRNNLSWQHKQTQPAFNRMRVAEELQWFADKGLAPTCISCGGTLGGDQWCCGHFKTQGGNSRLRYDRKNTFLQHNVRCNKHLSGDIAGTHNTHGYQKGLIIRFGQERGQTIIDHCESNKGPKKWECDEVEAMRKVFNQVKRDLTKDIAA